MERPRTAPGDGKGHQITDEPRVHWTETDLVVGGRAFPAPTLASWAAWNVVESALRRLDPPYTAAEVEVVCNGPGNANGKQELRSALARP